MFASGKLLGSGNDFPRSNSCMPQKSAPNRNEWKRDALQPRLQDTYTELSSCVLNPNPSPEIELVRSHKGGVRAEYTPKFFENHSSIDLFFSVFSYLRMNFCSRVKSIGEASISA